MEQKNKNDNKSKLINLIENIKGIKELKINSRFKNNLDKKIQAIYGPNGSGKSSIKNGLINKENAIKNWKAKETDEIFISDKLKNNIFIVFDEKIIELVRKGSENKIMFFGKEIQNLFELIDERKELQDFEFENLFEKYKNINFNEIILKIEDLKKIIKHLSKEEEEIYSEINTNIFNLFIEKWKELFKIIFKKIIISYNYQAEISKFEHFLKDLKNNQINDESSEKNKWLEEIENYYKENNKQELQKQILNYLKNIKEFFESFHFVINNFGYIKLKESIFDSLINNKDYIPMRKEEDLVKFISVVKEKQKELKDAWEKIHKRVLSIEKTTNIILQTYMLNYEIELKEIDINKKISQNFSLKHIVSNKKLNQKQIEESVSFGELSIISLSLFLASCINRNIEPKTSFIFDDPISSYDLNRVQITISIINNLIIKDKNVHQVWFLSHEKYFIKSLKWTFDNKGEISFYKLNNKKDYHLLEYKDELEDDIIFWKIIQNSQNELAKNLSKRFFIELLSKITNKNLQKKKDKINEAIYDQTKEFKNILNEDIEIDIEDSITLKTLIKKKTYLKIKEIINDNYEIIDEKNENIFFTLINKEKERIIKNIKKQVDIKPEDIKILRVSMYRIILNKIGGHSDGGEDADLVVSRSSEIVDMLYSDITKIIEYINTAFKVIFKEEKKDKIIKTLVDKKLIKKINKN